MGSMEDMRAVAEYKPPVDEVHALVAQVDRLTMAIVDIMGMCEGEMANRLEIQCQPYRAIIARAGEVFK